MDLFPTLAALAGAKLPEGLDLDGRNLLPLLENPSVEWPDRMTFFHQGRWKKAGAPGNWGKGNTSPDADKYKNFAVRSERWRYIRYADGTEELYDHSKDPHEWKNLAGDGRYSAVIAQHRKWIPKDNARPQPRLTGRRP